MKIESIRTPEERFEILPASPFSPNNEMLEGDLRIQYQTLKLTKTFSIKNSTT